MVVNKLKSIMRYMKICQNKVSTSVYYSLKAQEVCVLKLNTQLELK